MTAYSLGTHKDGNSDLQALGDPEFFAHWTIIRQSLVLIPKSSPKHPEIKRRYDAVAREYRRRIEGDI